MNTSHYPSLELCKKLTEIGFPCENVQAVHAFGEVFMPDSPDFQNDKEWCLCPSVMEMLDVIPRDITFKGNHKIYTGEYHRSFRMNHIATWYINPKDDFVEISFYDSSLPNALAEMILWLHENNYINFK